MKLLRFGLILMIFIMSVFLQSCGSGGGSDTSGSLTLSALASTNNNNGSFNVSTTVTFTPPAGKVPNGVEIKRVVTVQVGAGNPVSISLDPIVLDDSPTRFMSITIPQSTAASTNVRIVVSIGDKTSSDSIVIPALAPVSALPIQFLSTDPAGTSRTTTISGGIAPYSLQNISTTELTATLTGTTLTVINQIAPATGATPVATVGTVTVGDSNGSSFDVNVTYFK